MRLPSRPEHQASLTQSAEAARLWLFGTFWVSVGSENIASDAWRLEKAATLVKSLALVPATVCTGSRS
jgi:hypothetical protein